MLRLELGFARGGTSFGGLSSACSAPPGAGLRARARPRCLPAFPPPQDPSIHLHPLPLSVSCPAVSPSKVPPPGDLGGGCVSTGVWAGGAGWAALPDPCPAPCPAQGSSAAGGVGAREPLPSCLP